MEEASISCFFFFGGGAHAAASRLSPDPISFQGLVEKDPRLSTRSYQNLLFCRVPINSIIGFIVRANQKSGLW